MKSPWAKLNELSLGSVLIDCVQIPSSNCSRSVGFLFIESKTFSIHYHRNICHLRT